LILLIAWVFIDLFYPFKADISRIDAIETARMDAAMWRSYYEKKPLKLFFQSAKLMREEFHFPFWRSFGVSYYAAKAAFVFKNGANRNDYQKALPSLKKYYSLINKISQRSFNVDSASIFELEWWIARRYREQYPPEEWEKLLAISASVVYHLPVDSFSDYASLRVRAMLLRDAKGSLISESNWLEINQILLKSWQSFAEKLRSRNALN
jgi:hypothetical protein